LKPDDKIAAASSLGASAHLALMVYSLEKYGDANYFKNMVGMSLADVMASMSNTEDLAAAASGPPFAKEEEEKEVFELLLDLSSYGEEYTVGNCWAISQSFFEENPAYVEALNSARQDTVDFIKTQPEEAAAIMQKYWAAYSIEKIVDIFEESNPSLEISESAYNKLANFMYDIDLLENPPKPLSELPNYDSLPLIP
jgi:ABC-type nitrate/sulfonate/bicarbonate transport system substrate-binding protein